MFADLVPLERERQEYVAAISGNDVLKRLTADDTPLAREQSAASGESERRFGHGHYRAKGWPRAPRGLRGRSRALPRA